MASKPMSEQKLFVGAAVTLTDTGRWSAGMGRSGTVLAMRTRDGCEQIKVRRVNRKTVQWWYAGHWELASEIADRLEPRP